MRRFFKAPYLIIGSLVLSMTIIVSCKHDDEAIESASIKYTHGTDVLLPGNMTAGDTSQWKFDKVHSNVMWQSAYQGAAGLLTGRFNQFGLADVTDSKAINYVTTGQPLQDKDWAFYEGDPSKTVLNGYVQINTSNTGEPGRDAGCNIAGMGTVAIVTGTQNLTAQNMAKIQTTKVEFDPAGPGYLVTLNLTYQGKLASPKTVSIPGYLTYVAKKNVQFGTAAAYGVFGLKLKFQFNCRDFGIVSTSVADKIEIECNANFNNK
jgi:polyisoprenoid-binding protein YceI